MDENAVPTSIDIAARIAAQTLSKRGADYADEVRRLLDGALRVIAEKGTTDKARVADIVAAAGLSNEAFYRHFPSKDALVAAIVEDGTQRLASYVGHQMGKEPDLHAQIRRWVEAVLSQADERLAAVSLAVLWNGSPARSGFDGGRPNPSGLLAALLQDPFRRLGSPAPEMDAILVAHATVGRMTDHLWAGTRPDRSEIERITEFCVHTATRPRRAK